MNLSKQDKLDLILFSFTGNLDQSKKKYFKFFIWDCKSIMKHFMSLGLIKYQYKWLNETIVKAKLSDSQIDKLKLHEKTVQE